MLEALLLALFGFEPETSVNPNLKRVNVVQASRERDFVQYAEQKIDNSDEFKCFDELMHRESSWRTRKDPQFADNPKSSAYGIPQALPGHKMESAGTDWRTNPVTQIRWAISYIEERYETPCKALKHHDRKGWY
jgi:hypothetical protein